MDGDTAFTELIADFAELVEKEHVGTASDSLSILQMRVLSDLYFRQASPTMRQLAKAANITMPSASVITDKLETEGFLVRRLNPTDRRIVQAHLTAKGRKVIEAQTNRLHRVLDKATQGFSDKDKEVVRLFFQQFIAAAKAH